MLVPCQSVFTSLPDFLGSPEISEMGYWQYCGLKLGIDKECSKDPAEYVLGVVTPHLATQHQPLHSV